MNHSELQELADQGRASVAPVRVSRTAAQSVGLKTTGGVQRQTETDSIQQSIMRPCEKAEKGTEIGRNQ